jgi:hypothetical protein
VTGNAGQTGTGSGPAEQPGRPEAPGIPAPKKDKTASGSPVRVPKFDVLGAEFDDPGAEFNIRKSIATACGGDQCLKFVLVGGTPGNPSCKITGLPTPGKEVPRGSLLTFTVTCSESGTDPGNGTQPQNGTQPGSGTDKGGTDKGGTDKGGTDKGGTDKGGTDKGGTGPREESGRADESADGKDEGNTKEGNDPPDGRSATGDAP